MPDLSIVIVSYNCRSVLGLCLESLRNACRDLDTEILVIDNASTDGAVETLRLLFPMVTFFENKENLGFAKANNLGIKKAASNKILLLNPDTIVFASSLLNSLELLESEENVAALGIRMIDAAGKFLPESKRGIPTPWRSFCRLTGFWKLGPTSKFLSGYYAGWINEKSNQPIEVLSGAYLLFDRKKLGPDFFLDEQFFMFGEDIDFSFRILKNGFKNYYLGSNTILHFKGESYDPNSDKYLKDFYGAMSLFQQKHFSNSGPGFFYRLAIAFFRKFRQSKSQEVPVASYFSKALSFVEDPIFEKLLQQFPGRETEENLPWPVFDITSADLENQLNLTLNTKIGGMAFWNPQLGEYFLSAGKNSKGRVVPSN